MGKYCLIPSLTKAFKEKLKSGEINPDKLSEMTSKERHKFFSDFLGEENATNVNSLFESKLLLKNQKKGMINWAKTITNLKPEVRRDIITKIEKMDKVLTPENEQVFLSDLAETKLEVGISFEEAKVISELSNKLQKTKGKVDTEGNNFEYGAAKVALNNYINDLKIDAAKLSPKEFIKSPSKWVEVIAGTSKGIKASLDNSALFRQGWKAMMANPKIWGNNALKSFQYIWKQLKVGPKDSSVIDGIKADIYGRKNAIDNRYQKMKLDIGTGEEAFPTTLPEKIPIFNRLYKASETAYTGFLYRLRADIADKYIEIAKKNDIAIDDAYQLQSMGRVINSLTGRGSLGSFEKVGKTANMVFFSPKKLVADFDTLLQPLTGRTGFLAYEKISPFARKQSALNLLKIISGTATVLGTASVLMPGSVEWDPRSSNFGKIRIKDTRFDVTGGMASMVTLAARLISNSTKSSSTGVVSKLGEGYGSSTGFDVVVDYFTNKLSPAMSVVKDLLKGSDFSGNKITIGGEVYNLLVPLPVSTTKESLTNPNAANPLLIAIADGLGIAASTYSYENNWESSTSKELTQFREKLGDKVFKQANKEYNQLVNDEIKKLNITDKFKKLPPEEQYGEISALKSDLKDKIFLKYNFKYVRAKS